MFFHFLSFFFFFLFFSYPFFLFFFFSRVLKIFFFASIAARFHVKALMEKLLGRLGKYPIGPSFFSRVSFSMFFHFRFLFQFLSMFFLLFLICFSFFIFYSFIFLLFSFKKCFFLFHFVSLFFSGAQNLWRHYRIPWGKVHILSWLYLLCIGSSSLFPVE